MTSLTKADLRDLHALVTAHQPPGRRVSLEEVVRAGELASKLTTMVAEHRAVEERGVLVLEWRLPPEWALTLNEMSGLRHRRHMLKSIGNKLADDLRKVLARWPAADLQAAKRRRLVEVRRFSPIRPDDRKSADAIGGKQALDMLTHAGVIVDDDEDWIVRDADWLKCPRGATHVCVRVFELVTSGGRTYPEPVCLPPPRPVKKQGVMLKAIAGGAA